MRSKERSHLQNITEAASADVDPVAGYPEDLTETIKEGGYINNRLLILTKQSYY